MSENSTEPQPRRIGALSEAVRFTGTTLAVAVFFATVFTMWSPNALLPSGAAEQLARALATETAPEPTPTVGITPTPLPVPRIGIVAGHLGNDSGAVCPDDGLTEVSINLDVAQRVKAGLEAQGFVVDLLEEFDFRLEGYQADALLSIHADSCEYINDLATGYKVTGSLDSYVPTESQYLANCLIDRYGEATGMFYHENSITYDMTYYHAYREIAPDTPAAIIEVGFMKLDRDILTNQPDVVARGIVNGLLCYIYKEPLDSTAEGS